MLSSIMINSANAKALAAFWSSYLETGIEAEHEEFTWLGRRAGETRLAFQQVDNPTEGRRRLHLDFGSHDVEADIARAVALGATAVEDHAIDDFHWHVLADPDGNEFCIGPVED
ncbi:VOC family protein [Arthrobacter sp. 35W]|uniref:VOC family protein n=1 Tax=Arthrobacter sp. 35W TaxID=1132441 RepID=UPI001E6363C6|nr:VOC family protein [Arthrobacter sp. 35W]